MLILHGKGEYTIIKVTTLPINSEDVLERRWICSHPSDLSNSVITFAQFQCQIICTFPSTQLRINPIFSCPLVTTCHLGLHMLKHVLKKNCYILVCVFLSPATCSSILPRPHYITLSSVNMFSEPTFILEPHNLSLLINSAAKSATYSNNLSFTCPVTNLICSIQTHVTCCSGNLIYLFTCTQC